MDKLAYKSATKQCFTGIIVAIVLTCVAAIAQTILIASLNIAPLMVLPIVICIGWVIYLLGLGKLERALDNPEDAGAVKKLRIATIITIVINLLTIVIYYMLYDAVSSFDLGKIYTMGNLATYFGLVSIIPLIINIIGYNSLKNSSSFPGTKGANLLFISQILYAVGVVLALIPVAGSILGGLVNIAAFVLYIVGWVKIKNAEVVEE